MVHYPGERLQAYRQCGYARAAFESCLQPDTRLARHGSHIRFFWQGTCGKPGYLGPLCAIEGSPPEGAVMRASTILLTGYVQASSSGWPKEGRLCWPK